MYRSPVVWGGALALAWLSLAAAQQSSGRILVRRIEFEGISSVDDAVLRGEVSQLEGTYIDTVAVEQSRQLLERLPYVDRVRVELKPVPGAADVVDVVFHIDPAPAHYYGGGGGYSESIGPSLRGYYIDENLLGTGQRLAISVEGSDLRSAAEISHSTPRARPGGARRTIALARHAIDRLASESTAFDARSTTARLDFTFPAAGLSAAATAQGPAPRAWACCPVSAVLDPTRPLGMSCCGRGTLDVGLELGRLDLAAGADASDQLHEWIAANGSGGTTTSTSWRELDFLLGWRVERLDEPLFPSRGREQSLSMRIAVPGSGVEYYSIDYEASRYWTPGGGWTALLHTHFGLDRAYGNTSAPPPYLNRLAGGPSSVRGFRESSLGPRDSLGRPYGGNLLAAAQLELLAPWPERWRKRARIGFFFDVGNAFASGDTEFVDGNGERLDYGFDWGSLKRSYGVAAHVLIPLGILSVSYGVPIDPVEDVVDPFRRDDVHRLQISIGVHSSLR